MAPMIGFALIILYMIGYDLYEKISDWISHWWNVRKYHPEHLRDRNKRLEVGQVWEDHGWTTTITAISTNRVEYIYYSPKVADYAAHSGSSSGTFEEFRQRIDESTLHLRDGSADTKPNRAISRTPKA